MIATKLTPSQVNLEVTGITILSVDEAKRIPISIRKSAHRYDWQQTSQWWLRTPGLTRKAAYVFPDGKINTDGAYVDCGISQSIGVKPVLTVANLTELKLGRGSKVNLAGLTWTVINEQMLLCDHIVGTLNFRDYGSCNDRYYEIESRNTIPVEELNDFEHSDIKKYLDRWASENGIQFETAETAA